MSRGNILHGKRIVMRKTEVTWADLELAHNTKTIKLNEKNYRLIHDRYKYIEHYIQTNGVDNALLQEDMWLNSVVRDSINKILYKRIHWFVASKGLRTRQELESSLPELLKGEEIAWKTYVLGIMVAIAKSMSRNKFQK